MSELIKHPNARYIVLATYALGISLVVVGYIIPYDWSVYIMVLGTIMWLPPIVWCTCMLTRRES